MSYVSRVRRAQIAMYLIQGFYDDSAATEAKGVHSPKEVSLPRLTDASEVSR